MSCACAQDGSCAMRCASAISGAASAWASRGAPPPPQPDSPTAAALDAVSKTVGQRLGKLPIANLLLCSLDGVRHTTEGSGECVGVEQQPCGAGVAVARLPDRPGVDQPAAAAELRRRPAGNEAALDGAAVPREREGDVTVADEDDGRVRLEQRDDRRLLAQHVLPHGVPRARVEELGVGAPRERLERREPLPLLVAEHAGRPARRDRSVAAELARVERAADGEVVVAAKGKRRPLPNQVAAFVRPRPVADDVAEAPELVDGGPGVDIGQHGFECVQVSVNVRDDGDTHGEGRHASCGGRGVGGVRVAPAAHERPRAPPLRRGRAPVLPRARARARPELRPRGGRALARRSGGQARRARRAGVAPPAQRARDRARARRERNRRRDGAAGGALVRRAAVQPRRPLVAAPLGAGAVRRGSVARGPMVDARAGGRLGADRDRRGRRPGQPVPPVVAPRVAGARRSRRPVRLRLRLAGGRFLAPAARRAAPRGHSAARARRARAGDAVRVQDVSTWTTQANAFTVGFGPSTHVILWNTLLDGRFSRGEEDVVVAHELGHVRSGHIPKAIGWSALITLPALWLLGLATRRRGGVGDPANLPFVVLVLAVLALLAAPAENAVSRRYESEADWRALNAARDPVSQTRLFQAFGRTSLEDPSPPLLDYLWLENHPTLMQRIAMARQWSVRRGRSSRGGPGSP